MIPRSKGGPMANRKISRRGLFALSLFLALGGLGSGCASTSADEADFALATDDEQLTRIDDLKLLLPEATWNTITKESRDNAACRESNREALGLSDLPNGQWYYTYANVIAAMAESPAAT